MLWVNRHDKSHNITLRFIHKLVDLTYAFSYWLSIPLCCKLYGHEKIKRYTWNSSAFAMEEVWWECMFCKHWMGWHPDDPWYGKNE